MTDAPHYEQQYLDLMRHVWTAGDERVDRTGVGTRSVFGATLRFSLADNAIPLLTTKRVYWKTARKSVVSGKSVSVSLNPGGRGIIKKKTIIKHKQKIIK